MHDLFKQARPAIAGGKRAKEPTVWTLPTNKRGQSLGQAIAKFNKACAAIKTRELEKKEQKEILEPYAETCYLEAFAEAGVEPSGPMQLFDPASGQSVTYVVKDCSSSKPLDNDQVDQLQDLIGEDAAAELLETRTTYALDSDLLQKAAVREAISRALEGLVKKKELTKEQLERLIVKQETTVLREGVLGRLAAIAGNQLDRMGAVLEAAGKASTRYVQAG